MIDTFVNTLPMVAALAFSPVLIIAVLVMLLTDNALANALAFISGWLLAISLATVTVYYVPAFQLEGGEPSANAAYVRLLLGVVLLIVALRCWGQRPRLGVDLETPGYLAFLERLGFWGALACGFALVALSAKNLPLALAGANVILSSQLLLAQQMTLVVVFVVLCGSVSLVPVFAYLILKQGVEDLLSRWKNWLIRNNAYVSTTVWALLGVWLMQAGISVLVP
jgi:hypothetical protein